MPMLFDTDIHNCDNCGDDFDLNVDGREMDCGCCYRCEDCAHGYNDDCEDEDDYNVRGVRAWNYRPDPYRPKGNYPTEALLGVELEVGGRARAIVDAVHTVDDDEDHLYMKEDGSISGVEIVTHPMTLAYAKTFPFDNLIRQLNWAGAYVDDGYGLHVHVSRAAFRRNGHRSAGHAMAWLMFMYRNAVEVQSIARRSNSRWAAFNTPTPGEIAHKAVSSRSEDNRYVAVNCNNTKTYELRFFASTLSETEFYAAIEFADATVEYTRGIKTSDVLRGSALSWNHFARFIRAEQERYPNLSVEIDRLAPDTGVDESVVKVRPVPRNRNLLRSTALRRAGNGGVIEAVPEFGGARYLYRVRVRADGDYMMRADDQGAAFSDDWYSPDMFRPGGWSVVAVGDTSNAF